MDAGPESQRSERDDAAEADIRRHVDRLIELLHLKDLDALALLYAEDVVSFDVEPPLQHLGRAAKMRNWAKAFGFFAELGYELRELSVTVGDDVAFAHGFGRLSGTLADGSVAAGMWVRATFCLRRIDGEWLIVHDQASVPFDIRTGKGVTDLEP
jgi:ketosteroid isomerase-like protein